MISCCHPGKPSLPPPHSHASVAPQDRMACLLILMGMFLRMLILQSIPPTSGHLADMAAAGATAQEDPHHPWSWMSHGRPVWAFGPVDLWACGPVDLWLFGALVLGPA